MTEYYVGLAVGAGLGFLGTLIGVSAAEWGIRRWRPEQSLGAQALQAERTAHALLKTGGAISASPIIDMWEVGYKVGWLECKRKHAEAERVERSG